jgi:hypothetical protein
VTADQVSVFWACGRIRICRSFLHVCQRLRLAKSDPQREVESAAVGEKSEKEFNQQVEYSCHLRKNYIEAKEAIDRLRRERDALRAPARAQST